VLNFKRTVAVNCMVKIEKMCEIEVSFSLSSDSKLTDAFLNSSFNLPLCVLSENLLYYLCDSLKFFCQVDNLNNCITILNTKI
jgi:hypothetical protein